MRIRLRGRHIFIQLRWLLRRLSPESFRECRMMSQSPQQPIHLHPSIYVPLCIVVDVDVGLPQSVSYCCAAERRNAANGFVLFSNLSQLLQDGWRFCFMRINRWAFRTKFRYWYYWLKIKMTWVVQLPQPLLCWLRLLAFLGNITVAALCGRPFFAFGRGLNLKSQFWPRSTTRYHILTCQTFASLESLFEDVSSVTALIIRNLSCI